LKCEEVLNKLQIAFETQLSLPDLTRRYFDFAFELNGKKYLLEYDGIQHFERRELFDYSDAELKKRQKHDIEKSKHAVTNGYHLIRIDHTQLHKVEEHLIQAMNVLQGKFRTYHSNSNMYEYITQALAPRNILLLPLA
jgi:very-short-patch-repair endonuclease